MSVSNPRVHLQEDDCIYSYGMVRYTWINISSLVDRRVCSIRLPYRTIPYHNCIYYRLPEDEPSVSKHV